jgi:hypothetical protein
LVGYCQKEQYICDQIGDGAQMIVDCWFKIAPPVRAKLSGADFPMNMGLHRERLLEERKLLIIHF